MPTAKSVSKNNADETEKAPRKRRTKQPAPEQTTETTPPKPGRKTKGSKIITKQQLSGNLTTPPIANVILNLKCSMTDLKEYNAKLSKMISNPLEYNSSVPPEVKYYEGENNFAVFTRNDHSNFVSDSNSNREDNQLQNQKKDVNSFREFSDYCLRGGEDGKNDVKNNLHDNMQFFSFSAEEQNKDVSSIPDNVDNQTRSYINVKIGKNELEDKNYGQDEYDDVNVKDMSAKLKQLKIQLYKNSLHSEKKSACFWCTYDFDNAPCYIPKYEMDGTIYGYGSFCRPECAVAYLMRETIDDSTKFDRYHLLNQIYSKVYECKKNIKPAPDPHYLLDKFYGNLTIQEYRRLLKTEHLLLVIDKPLTRILPELHEDTDDAFTKIYGIKATTGNSSGVYKVKRQSEQPQGPSKASIIKNTFGITN